MTQKPRKIEVVNKPRPPKGKDIVGKELTNVELLDYIKKLEKRIEAIEKTTKGGKT